MQNELIFECILLLKKTNKKKKNQLNALNTNTNGEVYRIRQESERVSSYENF